MQMLGNDVREVAMLSSVSKDSMGSDWQPLMTRNLFLKRILAEMSFAIK